MKKIKQFLKENKWVLIIILVTWPLLIVLIHLLIGLLLDFIKHDLTIKSGPWIWIKESVELVKVWPIIVATLFIYWLIIWKWFKHKPLKPHTKEVVNDDYGNAKWIEQEKFNELFQQVQFNNSHQASGFIAASEKENNKTLVNLASNTHCLIIGGTGSGKTQGLVIPTIQTNAFSTIKPSMIITDPKGELYQSQSQLLQEQGFDIKTLNLRDAAHSICWNPLATIYDKWLQARIIILSKQEKTNRKEIDDYNIRCYSHNQYPCQVCLSKVKRYYWVYQKQWFYSNRQCDQVLQQEQLVLQAEMRNDLKDLTISLYPDDHQDSNSFWNKNARKLFKAVTLALIEDLEQYLKMNPVLTCEEELQLIKQYLPLEKFNLATITHIISQQDEMLKWLKTRTKTSAAKTAANTILSSMGGQLSGIYGTATTELELFEEPLIQNIICQNDLDFNEISLKPTVIFIIVPDERTEHHFFVSLFIGQVYKALVAQANGNGGKLIRPVYFLLDEFANLPAITNMEAIITVARSRNIFFQLVIQDFTQLETKYNKAIANVIFANCSLHIFLQTMNLETAKKYSEMIGQKTLLKISVSGKGKNQSPQANLDHTNLISVSELIQLPNNEAIVVYSQQLPAKVKLLPWYQAKPYYHGQIQDKVNLTLINFYPKYYYDFKKSFYFPQIASKQVTTSDDSFKALVPSDIKTEIKNLKVLLKEYDKKKTLDPLSQEMKQTLINKIQELENLIKQKARNSINGTISNDNND